MTKENPFKAVIITGPTAGGKTQLSVQLALALGGEILNADSMQVYRGMDIGTAKPTPDERKGVPHHLMDVVEPDEDFNAAQYRSLALPLIKEINLRGKICFIVGGTGLYIKVLQGGLMECPPRDDDLMDSLIKEWERYGPEVLHSRLKRIDPDSAGRIHPNDRSRVIRALEVFYLSGKPVSALTAQHAFQDRSMDSINFCLDVDRDELYFRINTRAEEMIENGLIQETERLLAKGYSPDLRPIQALGYRHMVKFLQGEWSLEEAKLKLQRDTRRYAKRQLTWFRGNSDFTWIGSDKMDVIMDHIEAFVKGQG